MNGTVFISVKATAKIAFDSARNQIIYLFCFSINMYIIHIGIRIDNQQQKNLLDSYLDILKWQESS